MRKDAQPPTGGIYRPRNPRVSPLYQCVRRHSDELDAAGLVHRSVEAEDLDQYFDAVKESVATLPLADDAEVLGEPGRALSAPGMSAVVEVLLRKDNRLFINDGMFGIFWLLRIDGPDSFPVRAYRGGKPLEGETISFQLNGPTCDSTDTLPGLVPLPADIRSGDYLEFGNIGAYSIGGRTDYNGFYSDRIVTITSPSELPPMV